MVKPDIKHNYYSDLELPTTASVDDIRKAYRKLALQYHPDRNAGKEDECVPRFQAIQAANEVLSDPTTKAKYDQDRRKAGLYPTFQPNKPTSGNPYAATSNYPPPPRRTQPGTWQRPNPTYGAAGAAPSGADRFTNFPRPGNSAPRKDPAAERAQQFRAWQNMNNANEKSKSQYQAPPPPQPPRSPNPQTQNTARSRMPRQDTKMPTEEQIRAGMRYGKASAAGGDGPAAEKQSAWQAFQQSNSGKPGMGRNSRRAPTTPRRPGGFDPNAPGSDERPAPQSTGHYSHRNRSEDLSPGGFPPPPPGPPPGSAPHSPTADKFQRPFTGAPGREVPYAEGNRKSTPYASFVGEKLQFSSDGLRRSASTRDTTRLQPESNSTSTNRARSSSPAGRQSQSQSTATGTPGSGSKKPFTPGGSSESSTGTEGSSEYDPDVTETPEEMDSSASNSERHRDATFSVPPDQRPKKTPKRPSSKLNNGSNYSSNATSPAFEAPGAQSDGDGPGMQQRKSSQNIFTFPINNDTFTSTASKSRSFDNINTKFSPDGWNGSFNSTAAPDYFAAAGRRPSPGRRAPSSRGNGRAATADVPPRSNSNTPGDMGPPPRPPQPTSTYASPADTAFNEEQWKDTFKDPSWTIPAPGSNGGASSKTPSRKSSKLHSKTSAEGVAGSRERPHIVIDDEDTVEVQGSNGKPGAGVSVEEEDAMDIDPSPPAHHTGQTTPKGPRLYSVPKSPWREAAEKQSGSGRKGASFHRKQNTEPELKTNLDDFAHVEPFAPSSAGLGSFADMSSTLPFQSQSQHSRTASGSDRPRVQTPKVPKAPQSPQNLSKASWHSYALEFSTYLNRFHDFNKTMLTHFDAREKQVEDRLSNGPAWLEAIGDTSQSQGFASYWKGVQEDEQVRETWDIANEKHSKAVEEFDRVRELVRKLSVQGALKDS